MKIELEFTQDYAVHKKGDRKVFSHQLGRELINLGVAVQVGVQVTKKSIQPVEPVKPPKTKVEKAPQTKEEKPVKPPKK